MLLYWMVPCETVWNRSCSCRSLYMFSFAWLYHWLIYYLKPTVKLSNCQTVIASRLYIKKRSHSLICGVLLHHVTLKPCPLKATFQSQSLALKHAQLNHVFNLIGAIIYTISIMLFSVRLETSDRAHKLIRKVVIDVIDQGRCFPIDL